MPNRLLKNFAPRWIIFCCDILLISGSFVFSFFLVRHLSLTDLFLGGSEAVRVGRGGRCSYLRDGAPRSSGRTDTGADVPLRRHRGSACLAISPAPFRPGCGRAHPLR